MNKNPNGRPAIAGRVSPVRYGASLLAEIDRQRIDCGQSRAAWLRDTALDRVNAEAPDTLAWTDLEEAGIDIIKVFRNIGKEKGWDRYLA